MAENVTLARPYAEAAFQLARGGNALAAWSQSLGRMAIVAGTAEMQECIANPRLSPEQLKLLFVEVVGDGLSADQQNFARVLVDNDRISVLPEIAELFDELKNAQEGVQDADVESAFPLDQAATAALTADLERKFNCRIKATVRVVPDLIGGVRISLGDEVIDASVRGKLAAMATALKN
ncbi:MAG: F0F1 ATP synthase subunit delta [Proteobacteria bacterium]|nr:F0F1 ATP synthase subunit delta [Pseudomonadota bacterium]HQR03521.1 F0F1 ATP synthase subunit delta [Rhodocyclaceae bacterium]